MGELRYLVEHHAVALLLLDALVLREPTGDNWHRGGGAGGDENRREDRSLPPCGSVRAVPLPLRLRLGVRDALLSARMAITVEGGSGHEASAPGAAQVRVRVPWEDGGLRRQHGQGADLRPLDGALKHPASEGTQRGK